MKNFILAFALFLASLTATSSFADTERVVRIEPQSIYEITYGSIAGGEFWIKADGSAQFEDHKDVIPSHLKEGELYVQKWNSQPVPSSDLFLVTKNAKGELISVASSSHNVYGRGLPNNVTMDWVAQKMKTSKLRGVYGFAKNSFSGNKLKSNFVYSVIDLGTIGDLADAGLMDPTPGRSISALNITKEVCDDYDQNKNNYQEMIDDAAQLGLDKTCIPDRSAQACKNAENRLQEMYAKMDLPKAESWNSVATLTAVDPMLPPMNMNELNTHRAKQDWARFLRDIDRDRETIGYRCEEFAKLW